MLKTAQSDFIIINDYAKVLTLMKFINKLKFNLLKVKTLLIGKIIMLKEQPSYYEGRLLLSKPMVSLKIRMLENSLLRVKKRLLWLNFVSTKLETKRNEYQILIEDRNLIHKLHHYDKLFGFKAMERS